MSKPVRLPGPDHPITIERTDARVVVTANGHVVADTTAALELRESTYPPVYYVPISDIDGAVLADSDSSTYCPYKGDASYHSVTTADGTVVDAAWTYREPYDAVAEIEGHLAFYTDRVEVTVQRG